MSSDDAEIELVLDRGEVVAGERRTPVCEIELELKGGSPAGLFTLARRIDAVAPVRLGVLAKAERGFRLLGPAARFVKAEPVELTPDMTAAAGFRHVAGACLRHFRLNEMLPGQRDVEALHQMRVALRRLRSAFSIHKEMLRDGRSDGLRDELRWLAGELGAARDLDVLVARSKAGEVRDRLKAARDDAYARADAALGSARARALMLDLAEWLAVGGWLTDPAASELRDRPVKDFAAAALDRLRRKVKKGGRNLATLDDEARHEVRKDAKKLRYAAEFFSSLFDGRRGKRRCRRFVDALEPLQDRLGALNDLATAREVLARIGLAEAPAAASLLPARKGRDALIEAAAEAHDAFVDVKRFWR